MIERRNVSCFWTLRPLIHYCGAEWAQSIEFKKGTKMETIMLDFSEYTHLQLLQGRTLTQWP